MQDTASCSTTWEETPAASLAVSRARFLLPWPQPGRGAESHSPQWARGRVMVPGTASRRILEDQRLQQCPLCIRHVTGILNSEGVYHVPHCIRDARLPELSCDRSTGKRDGHIHEPERAGDDHDRHEGRHDGLGYGMLAQPTSATSGDNTSRIGPKSSTKTVTLPAMPPRCRLTFLRAPRVTWVLAMAQLQHPRRNRVRRTRALSVASLADRRGTIRGAFLI